MKYLKWLWTCSGKSRGAIAADIMLNCAGIVLSLLFIWISKHLVDIAVCAESRSPLMSFSIALVASMTLRVVINAVRTSLEKRTYYGVLFSLRKRLYSRLLRSGISGRGGIHSGDAVNRLFSDVDVVAQALCQDFPSVFSTFIRLLAAFIFLIMIDCRLAIMILVITPLFVLLGNIFFTRLRLLTRRIRSKESEVQGCIQETVLHRTVIQAMERQDDMETRLERLQTQEMDSVMKRIGLSVFSRSMMSLAFGAGYSVALIWGVAGISSGAVTFGMLTAFLQLVGQIQGPSVTLARQMYGFVYTLASVDRLMEVEGLETEDCGEPVLLPAPAGIRIENLSFSYPDSDEAVFSSFSHDFKPGSKTAVTGPTGAGKSTLVKLILALVRPASGSVTLYSGDNAAESSPGTRVNIIYVPQGNTLLSGTIRDNLLMGNPDADYNMMWEALDTAAADFVRELPGGLDTRCGELGAGLSEGQAQRIAIARGLLRPGSIMLLDELSSSLDSETERRMLANLTSRNLEKTMIFITHRDVVEDYCDEVVRL